MIGFCCFGPGEEGAMDRESDLALVARRVAQARRAVARQRERILMLEAAGCSTRNAQQTLKVLIRSCHGIGSVAAEPWSRTIRGRFPRERYYGKASSEPHGGGFEGFGRLRCWASPRLAQRHRGPTLRHERHTGSISSY